MQKAPKFGPSKHDDEGGEICDPNPMQPPLGYKKSLSLHEQIAQQVRMAKLQLLNDMDVEETEDDADDFTVGDDFEPLSQYENDHMPSLKVLKQRAREINDAIAEANRKAAIAAHEKALGIKSPPTPAAQPPSPINNDQ